MEIIHLEDLNFFKDKREYIQGPDIINSIEKYISKHGINFRIEHIKFKSTLNTLPRFAIYKKENEDKVNEESNTTGKLINLNDEKQLLYFQLYNSNIKIKKHKLTQ